MKPLLTFIPVLLLLLVNACAPADPPTPITNEILTAVENTQIAATWTITPTPTVNYNIPTMVTWLNIDLLMSSSLESTIDAAYSVNNISFPNIPNSPNLIFRVDVGCICMNNNNCCTAQRTFVDVVESMKRDHFPSMAQMPSDVNQLMVVCSDQKTKSQIGAVAVSWQDVKNYLYGSVDGHLLGLHVTLTTAPTINP